MSKNDNTTKASDLAKASKVLRNRLESLAGKYFDFKFNARGHLLCIAGRRFVKTCNATSSFYMYTSDEAGRMSNINFNSPDGEEIPTKNAVARLLDCSKTFDICIGVWAPIKLLKSGETLESLAIEYDLLTI